MRAEVPVLTGMTEAAASDVEPAHFRENGRTDENRYQRRQNRQCTAVEKMEHDREPAEDFEPRQVKRQAYTGEPRQHFVVVDVVREHDRVERLNYAGVNKNPAEDKIDDAPGNFHLLKQTPNAQRRTSNRKDSEPPHSKLGVRR
jgi:hypothetical protein